jgi:hypothetical protein
MGKHRLIVVVEELIHLDCDGLYNEMGRLFRVYNLDMALHMIKLIQEERMRQALAAYPSSVICQAGSECRDLVFRPQEGEAVMMQSVGFKMRDVPNFYGLTSWCDILEVSAPVISRLPSSLGEFYGKEYDQMLSFAFDIGKGVLGSPEPIYPKLERA